MVLHAAGLTIRWVTGGGAAVEAHRLLQENLGPDNVEDLATFIETIGSSRDDRAMTRMLCAFDDIGVLAVVAGARLGRLNAAMLLYSAVRKDMRRRGVYSALRSKVLDALRSEDRRPLDYIVSELEPEGILWRYYRQHWDAWIVPCEYRVPDTQGLTPKSLDLVIVPVERRPGLDEIAEIVCEVYEDVYRLLPADSSDEYLSVVQSIQNDGPETGA
jgi:hypothetical protein